MRAIILMGVAGSGKTTVGQALSQRMGLPFYDGDLYHSASSISKMAGGTPLTDADRLPWLKRLRGLIDAEFRHSGSLILACSALKQSYRKLLGGEHVTFVYLKCGYRTLYARLRRRPEHYFRPEMLRSQFDTLQEPATGEAFVVDASADVPTVVKAICGLFGES